MSEQTLNRKPNNKTDPESSMPVHVVRRGAVAASVWRRQSPSGFAYYDFSLSRSWKSMSSEKTGYSRNFFESNQDEMFYAIAGAADWIAAQKATEPLNALAMPPTDPFDGDTNAT